MILADMPHGSSFHTQLGHDVLAVVVRRVDGWCCYIGAVPGRDHTIEWQEVRQHGTKTEPQVAQAICDSLFYPPIDTTGLEYAR